MSKLLLVDDEPGVLFTLKEVLEERGHEAVTARSGVEALDRLDGVEAVITDLSMPEMDGLALLATLRERDESLPVILLTAHGSERVAVKAMKAGAHDYLTKPFDIDEVVLTVERAVETRRLRIVSRRLTAEQAIGRRIVGESLVMQRLLEAVARIASRDVTVLLRGETGTGKELIAALLHAQSGRASKPFIRFNCAAIPGELAEAELFGHVRGAFTGAQGTRRGFFAQADGGTLLLDEVGELPSPIQAKLLRALQEGEIQPVGSGRIETVDVRIIASTNRDLEDDASSGRFRKDLYYRLAVIDMVVPPLRDRPEDIPDLAREFARRYGDKFGVDNVALTGGVLEHLREREWPGNVRQLENFVARLVALSTRSVIDTDALGSNGLGGAIPSPVSPAAAAGVMMPEGPSLREQVDAFERNIIARALASSGGNQSEAARRLGTNRVTLIDKIKKYDLA